VAGSTSYGAGVAVGGITAALGLLVFLAGEQHHIWRAVRPGGAHRVAGQGARCALAQGVRRGSFVENAGWRNLAR
jgi:hypothetical protein